MCDAGLEELETCLKAYIDHYSAILNGPRCYQREIISEQDSVVAHYREAYFNVITKVREIRAKHNKDINKDLTDVSDNTYVNY